MSGVRFSEAIGAILDAFLWLMSSDTRPASIARHLGAIAIYTYVLARIFWTAGAKSTPTVWALAAMGALIYYFPIQFAISRIFSQSAEPLPPLKHRIMMYAQFLLVLVLMGAIIVGLFVLIPDRK